jgi:hypothetical protein
MDDDKHRYYQERWSSLKLERSSWDAHWADIAKHITPRSSRFMVSETNRGDKKHNSIYDSTGSRALNVLVAGMMAGMTSPARPWFKIRMQDKELNDFGPVKVWCSEVTEVLQSIFRSSNFYRGLNSLYRELGAFGTGGTLLLPDYKNVIRLYSLTAGEYCIAQDYRGEVDTLYREYERTVEQVVREFGLENCSAQVKNYWSTNKFDLKVTIVHSIEPRKDRDTTMRDAKNMPWVSRHFEHANREKPYLRDSGFEVFRGLCPRWETTGGDTYGQSPGMEALGDVKQLQHEQLRKAQGIDYMVKPPLQVPRSMKEHEINTLPGGVTYVDQTGPQNAVRSAYDVNIRLDHLLEDIRDVRTRINSSFYADLFLMLANSARNTQMTATEVAERHEEKLLMLGPVVERLQIELLDPAVNMTFQEALKAGILPPPPPELQGQNLEVKYISILAQAQEAVGTNSVDRFVSTLGAIAAVKPEVLDKLDVDEWADSYSEMLGVDPKLIVASEQVALIRQARAQAAQAQAQSAMVQEASVSARNLATAGAQGEGAVQNAVEMFSGYQ